MVSPDSFVASLDPIDRERLVRLLAASGAQLDVQVLDQCGSTNALLMERARAGAPLGSAIVCEHQTAGKGRRGNAWASALGASLTFSLLWRFDSQPAALQGLSLLVAVACATALESCGARQIGLKWPNDLLFHGRKLGGILVETFQAAHGMVAVIGIGLNVRDSKKMSESLGHQVADLTETGVSADRTTLLAAQLTQLAVMLPEFGKHGFSPFRDAWLARHAWQGKQVWLGSGGRLHARGRAEGVAEDGALLVDEGGLVNRYYSGELSLRPL